MSKSICSTGLRWLWVVVAVLIIDLGSKIPDPPELRSGGDGSAVPVA